MIALLLLCGSAAQAKELTRQENDSVASALATVWGSYMQNTARKQGHEVNQEYMRGVREALELAAKDDAYFQGLSEGLTIAKRLRQVEELGDFKVDMDRFTYKLQRTADGKTTGFTPESADSYLNRFISSRIEEARMVEGSSAYLDSVAQREGILKTPTGVLFEVITEGEGDTPGPEDLVKVAYTGRLINGKVFNASPEGQPLVMTVSQAIPGFGEGLQMMKRGGKYRVYIPSEQGYGSRGVPGVIPPDVATIFDVDMIDFRALTPEEREMMIAPAPKNTDNNE